MNFYNRNRRDRYKKSAEYTFEFFGTKENFLNYLNAMYNKYYSSYYFNDYIVELVGDEIRFGVARGGHSGGYWFIPTIIEFDNRIEFSGKIRYIGPEDDRSKVEKIIDWIGLFLVFVLTLPILLIMELYAIIEWIVRKICKRPKAKTETIEEKLFDLMENHLKCIRK